MPLNSKILAALVLALVLWILWCIVAIRWLTPHIQLHYTFWDWFTSWVLCLLPVVAVAAVLVHRETKTK
jgi:uncharacterized membrane protein